ncbi:MAG: transglycosylase domain-containing protein [Clostridiales bacterium]|nr:transglycosylase domain-containing protein [Clostridiales bacterium]
MNENYTDRENNNGGVRGSYQQPYGTGNAPAARSRAASAAANSRSGRAGETAYGTQNSGGINGAEDSDKKNKKTKKKTKKKHPGLRRFGIIICSLCLIAMISVSTVGLYVMKYVSDFVNGEVAIDLDEYKANQSQTTIMYTLDDDGNEVELIRLHGEENRVWVDLDEIPVNLQNAFVALEDQRFYEHAGVDWIRTIGVIVVPSNLGQGGSTITQQLIKNLTGERDATFIRKFNEIKNALNLEKHYSKDTILEAYLNTLYLDAGCYGVQTAAEYYFGKDVGDLNLAECACLAVITKEPRTYDPIINPDNNKERRDYCLSLMLEQGYITQDEYEEAVNYDLVFTTDEDYVAASEDDDSSSGDMIDVDESNAGTAGEEEEEVQGYYIDYAIDKVIEDLMAAYSYTYNEAWTLVYYGGLRIHLAVDLDIQETIEDIYYNRTGFPTATNSYGEQVQSCMVIMDYTGRVVAIVGQAGEKESARCLNIATDSTRQPGSSIKPLSVYSLAIDSNLYTWSYPLVQNYGIIVNGERWPTNYGGDAGSSSSYVTIQQALAPSYNTVPAQIVSKIGVSECFNWLQDTFKITSLDDADMDYSALAVGGMTNGVYAIEMCAAYTTFGNGGVYYEPYCYYTVTNSSGSVVYLTHNDSGEQVMDEGTADVMNKLLQTVVTSSNGTGRNYTVTGFEMYAKTGTTSDEKDRWFIGATPYYVCATWMGYSEHAEALDFSTNYCGLLYQTVMNKIHANLPSKSFTYSDDLVQMTYCTSTGLIASSSCSSTATGWYKEDSIPATCTGHSYTAAADTEEEDDADDTGGDSGDTADETTTAAVTTTAAATTAAAAADEGNDSGDSED